MALDIIQKIVYKVAWGSQGIALGALIPQQHLSLHNYVGLLSSHRLAQGAPLKFS